MNVALNDARIWRGDLFVVLLLLILPLMLRDLASFSAAAVTAPGAVAVAGVVVAAAGTTAATIGGCGCGCDGGRVSATGTPIPSWVCMLQSIHLGIELALARKALVIIVLSYVVAFVLRYRAKRL